LNSRENKDIFKDKNFEIKGIQKWKGEILSLINKEKKEYDKYNY